MQRKVSNGFQRMWEKAKVLFVYYLVDPGLEDDEDISVEVSKGKKSNTSLGTAKKPAAAESSPLINQRLNLAASYLNEESDSQSEKIFRRSSKRLYNNNGLMRDLPETVLLEGMYDPISQRVFDKPPFKNPKTLSFHEEYAEGLIQDNECLQMPELIETYLKLWLVRYNKVMVPDLRRNIIMLLHSQTKMQANHENRQGYDGKTEEEVIASKPKENRLVYFEDEEPGIKNVARRFGKM